MVELSCVSQFEFGHNINQTCGASGPVVDHGRAVSFVSNSYTSQLTINVSQHLNGSTIECASDSGRQVGSSQILITGTPLHSMHRQLTLLHFVYQYAVDSLPPSNNITLSEVSNEQLTFSWSPVTTNCPSVHYNINATNCGSCSDRLSVTTSTSSLITCNISSTPPPTCTLTFQTVVCGSILGTISKLVVHLIQGLQFVVWHHVLQ